MRAGQRAWRQYNMRGREGESLSKINVLRPQAGRRHYSCFLGLASS